MCGRSDGKVVIRADTSERKRDTIAGRGRREKRKRKKTRREEKEEEEGDRGIMSGADRGGGEEERKEGDPDLT